jgi:hypothetical protein
MSELSLMSFVCWFSSNGGFPSSSLHHAHFTTQSLLVKW